MIIGIVDVDTFNGKKKYGGTIFPNIALCKIARWHRQRGDIVEWAIALKRYDIVYISKVFNFTDDDLTSYNADCIIRGGTGYDVTSRLPKDIDCCQPDYSIYPNIPRNMAYGFLTRGCPNRCPWCVVPRKEGNIRPYMDCEEIAIEGRTKLVLMDNNILAAGDYAYEQFRKIISRGYYVDFNQALDARLVDDRFAQLLSKIKWIHNRIRFGCDTQAQIIQCENAIEKINSYGYKGEYFLYTMLNDDFFECYSRLHYWWRRNHELRMKHKPNVYPFAQPYRDPDNPRRKIPLWQKDMARWANRRQFFQVVDFLNFRPRLNFQCKTYLQRYDNAGLIDFHLNNDPTNNDPSNLRALCQRCHLQYNAEHPAATKRKSKADSDKSLTLDFSE